MVTLTQELNQSKNPEPGDLVWLRPDRTTKKDMSLSGILKDAWALVTLTVPDQEPPNNPLPYPTWYITLQGMPKQAKV